MKNTTRIVALIGAILLVSALGVAAFAASSDNPPLAPTATTHPSDGSTPEPAESASVDNGNVQNEDHGNVQSQNEGKIDDHIDGPAEDD